MYMNNYDDKNNDFIIEKKYSRDLGYCHILHVHLFQTGQILLSALLAIWCVDGGFVNTIPDSKVHGANMGPTWVLVGPRWAPYWPDEPCYQGSYYRTASHLEMGSVNVEWRHSDATLKYWQLNTLAFHLFFCFFNRESGYFCKCVFVRSIIHIWQVLPQRSGGGNSLFLYQSELKIPLVYKLYL